MRPSENEKEKRKKKLIDSHNYLNPNNAITINKSLN